MAGKAVLTSLRHVWTALAAEGCPMALMGGLAVSAWKHVRNTQDVDLLVDLGQRSIEAIAEQLRRASVRTKHQPPVLDLGAVRIMQLLYEPPGVFMDIQVDLLLAESEYHQGALARRVPARIEDLDIEVAVLSCEDLLIHKLVAGRIIDRADAAALLRRHRRSLDLAYLSKWVTEFDLAAQWAEIRAEACPGESPPS